MRPADAEPPVDSVLPAVILLMIRRDAIAYAKANAVDAIVCSRHVTRRERGEGVGDQRDVMRVGGFPRGL